MARARFPSAPPRIRSAAWWKAPAKARWATRRSVGRSATFSPCRRATGSSTAAPAAPRACSRCPTATSMPVSDCSRKSTGTWRPELRRAGGGPIGARADHYRGSAVRPCGTRGGRRACCLQAGGDISRPSLVLRRTRPSMAHTANEKTASAAAASAAHGPSEEKARLWAMALGTLGVVYGDIGTSPLYAFREAVVAATEHGPVRRDIVLGVLSLILWALIVVVVIKYVLILLRADNNGEGGTLSLTALATRAIGRRTAPIFLLGVIGASMFLGGAVTTPAISVLSAIEGLKLVTPAFDHYVVPLTIAILLALFAGQSRGTARVASLFAPIMGVWFIAIAAAGLLHIRDDPGVLWAINPAYAVSFVYSHGHIGLITLGLVFLVVTGAEALYADLGHFGRVPIQRAWFGLVLPSLVLN